ncbi:hypothetical protein KKE26_05740 [bacterium]|nr:hypothetical protein [bacterium]MBU1753538.1 hypothetical protein [bacterium]
METATTREEHLPKVLPSCPCLNHVLHLNSCIFSTCAVVVLSYRNTAIKCKLVIDFLKCPVGTTYR